MSCKSSPNTQNFIELGKDVIQNEIDAISRLIERIDNNFKAACETILTTSGRIVVLGMGKSGHIAQKIAATLASTGTPAFFVHPGEASHGDLGMITAKDTVIALSNSGETPEILSLLPLLKRLNIKLIALCGRPHSSLAKYADIHLDVSVEKEACPLGLAPTSSTTTALVMGDALAVALLETRGFTSDDFARYHPGGSLGRRLLIKTCDLMHSGNTVPSVSSKTSIQHALLEITQKRLGMTTVVDDNNKLLGVFTDGDLRRCLDKNIDLKSTNIIDVIKMPCITINKESLAAEALTIMQQKKITSLVITENNKPTGIIHMHDILQAGI